MKRVGEPSEVANAILFLQQGLFHHGL
jgi:hypothetical protein